MGARRQVAHAMRGNKAARWYAWRTPPWLRELAPMDASVPASGKPAGKFRRGRLKSGRTGEDAWEANRGNPDS